VVPPVLVDVKLPVDATPVDEKTLKFPGATTVTSVLLKSDAPVVDMPPPDA
jgi:hypothetical protein